MLLEGRRLLVTGVLTESSIAFSIARRAQEEGAELVLTGFGRALRITQRVARRLPTEPDVLELDVNDPEQLEAVARELDGRWGRLDGLVHAIAFVPGDALGGNFLTAPSASAIAAFETSAFSLTTLAASNIEGFDVLAEAWQRQAPLGWDTSDPGPVADACLFLLSPLARAITGEILHVD